MLFARFCSLQNTWQNTLPCPGFHSLQMMFLNVTIKCFFKRHLLVQSPAYCIKWTWISYGVCIVMWTQFGCSVWIVKSKARCKFLWGIVTNFQSFRNFVWKSVVSMCCCFLYKIATEELCRWAQKDIGEVLLLPSCTELTLQNCQDMPLTQQFVSWFVNYLTLAKLLLEITREHWPRWRANRFRNQF